MPSWAPMNRTFLAALCALSLSASYGGEEEPDLIKRGPLDLARYVPDGGLLDQIQLGLGAGKPGKDAASPSNLATYYWLRLAAADEGDRLKIERGIIPGLLMSERDGLSDLELAAILKALANRERADAELDELFDDLTRVYFRKICKGNADYAKLAIDGISGASTVSLSPWICARVIIRLAAVGQTRNLWIARALDPNARFSEPSVRGVRLVLAFSNKAAKPSRQEAEAMVAGASWAVQFALFSGITRWGTEGDQAVMSWPLEKLRAFYLQNIAIPRGADGISTIFAKLGELYQDEKDSQDVINKVMTRFQEVRGEGLLHSDERFSADEKMELILVLVDSLEMIKFPHAKSHLRHVMDSVGEDLASPHDSVLPGGLMKLHEKWRAYKAVAAE